MEIENKEQEEQKSVEDSLMEAMNEIEQKEHGNEDGKADEKTEKTEDVTGDDEGKADGRERGEDGKFVKKSKAKTEEKAENVEEKPALAPVEKPKYKAPKAWETDEKLKADYEKLPEHIKQALDKREKEVEYGFTKLDEERNFGKQLKEVITPYMPMITAEGSDAVRAVRSVLNTAYQLRTAPPAQKAALFQELAAQYGVDLALVQQSASEVDPAMKQVMDKLSGLEQKFTQQSTLQEQENYNKIVSEIQTFAANPQNVHYAAVEQSLAPYLAQLKAQHPLKSTTEILQEAYDMACWATPEIRSHLILKQQTEQSEKRKQEIAKKKQAAVSVTGSPSPRANSGNSQKSIEQELSDVYDDLHGSRI